jgi:hypothetical protein
MRTTKTRRLLFEQGQRKKGGQLKAALPGGSAAGWPDASESPGVRIEVGGGKKTAVSGRFQPRMSGMPPPCRPEQTRQDHEQQA